jgi:hypothetical protein
LTEVKKIYALAKKDGVAGEAQVIKSLIYIIGIAGRKQERTIKCWR